MGLKLGKLTLHTKNLAFQKTLSNDCKAGCLSLCKRPKLEGEPNMVGGVGECIGQIEGAEETGNILVISG
jgi:hypothetical protein